MKVTDLLERSATLYPGRAAVIVHGVESISYAELRGRARGLAAGLAARGVLPGDRVALLADNGAVFFDVYLAAAYLGAAVVPVGTRLAEDEVRWILGDSRPALCVVDPPHRALLERVAAPGVSVVVTGSDDHLALLGSPTDGIDELVAEVRDDTAALVIYTSGTTGRPKGAVLDQAALTFNALTTALVQRLGPDDVWLSVTPLYHAAAASRVTTMLVDGQTHVVLPGFDLERCLDAVAEHRVTGTLMVPTQLGRLVDAPDRGRWDLSSLRLVVYGAAPTATDLIRRAHDELGVGLYQGYGLSEAVTSLTGLNPADHERAFAGRPDLLASCGRPVPGVDLQLRAEDGSPVGVGQVGEIWVRTDKLMSGYWANPAAAAEVLREGWLATGDLARRDDEGYLFIVGRSKDMLISGGVNVYPSEIEKVLEAHPAVVEAAVVGVPHPEWGEVPVAFVRCGPSEPDPTVLRDWCAGRLAALKVPVAYRVLPDFPRTATGKVRKTELRRLPSADRAPAR
jgi:fatty-acyl-CoA synthase